MTAGIILALIAVLMSLGITLSATQFRRSTEFKIHSLENKVMQLEGTVQHYQNQNAILTKENHDLLQRLVNKN